MPVVKRYFFPLSHPDKLHAELAELDGFVLPGSPADVNPVEYSSTNQGQSEDPDQPREETDSVVLGHAFTEHKPVLAICYGCQLLNVFLGGTLIQDLRTRRVRTGGTAGKTWIRNRPMIPDTMSVSPRKAG